MSLTTAQYAALKADILADATLNAFPHNSDGAFEIAKAYNLTAVPDFWVWRTHLPQAEIVNTTTADATVFSWPQFIARTVQEQAGWREMFADGGFIDASKANVRQGFADIFSGATAAPVAQRLHLLTVARIKATRIQKLFSAGLGSTASPATRNAGIQDGYQLSFADVEIARES